MLLLYILTNYIYTEIFVCGDIIISILIFFRITAEFSAKRVAVMVSTISLPGPEHSLQADLLLWNLGPWFLHFLHIWYLFSMTIAQPKFQLQLG